MKYIIKTGKTAEEKFQLHLFKVVEVVEFDNEADAKRARVMLYRTLKDAGHDVERMPPVTTGNTEPAAR